MSIVCRAALIGVALCYCPHCSHTCRRHVARAVQGSQQHAASPHGPTVPGCAESCLLSCRGLVVGHQGKNPSTQHVPTLHTDLGGVGLQCAQNKFHKPRSCSLEFTFLSVLLLKLARGAVGLLSSPAMSDHGAIIPASLSRDFHAVTDHPTSGTLEALGTLALWLGATLERGN